jgi:hypothetical protein
MAIMETFELQHRVLTDEEIIEEYKLGDNNGMLEFARSIELMTINKLKEAQAVRIAELEGIE